MEALLLLCALIYDMGGCTLDVSILTNENGSCEVKVDAGDIHLGASFSQDRFEESSVVLLCRLSV